MFTFDNEPHPEEVKPSLRLFLIPPKNKRTGLSVEQPQMSKLHRCKQLTYSSTHVDCCTEMIYCSYQSRIKKKEIYKK